ncbi:MAG: RibD family protein [Methanobacterium sp.]|nr:RibD family protein [Methanobacterium sp.]
MLPKVIIYNTISLDGALNFFNYNSKYYYEIASKLDIDAVLMGSNTLLKEINSETGELYNWKNLGYEIEPISLLVVPDSEGKIRIWSKVLEIPFVNDILVLCSRSTPQEYMNFLDELDIKYMIIGYGQVNFNIALEELNIQFGIKSLRVNSGGTLNGILLQDDLADELCILLNPVIGGTSTNPIYTTSNLENPGKAIDLKLIKVEQLKNEIIFLQYRVMKYQF